MPGMNNAEINAKIDTTIDSMLSVLKRQLLSPGGFERRGVWDRFKNWMSNLWHGRYGQKNPYYFINTLGDFAGSASQTPKKECFTPSVFTLHEYTVIKKIFDQLEESLDTFSEADMSGVENLKLMRILDDWSKQLKVALKNLMADHERTRPAPKDDSGKSECQKVLEQKHKEGKISNSDYTRISKMIAHGRIDQACEEIKNLPKTPDEPPKETEVEPKDKDVEKKPETDDKGGSEKGAETGAKEEPTEVEPKDKDVEKKPETDDKGGSEMGAETGTKEEPYEGGSEEWPLKYGNTKEDFDKIISQLNDDSFPDSEYSYKSHMADFIAMADAERSGGGGHAFETHQEYKKARRSIKDLIDENKAYGEEMEKLMKKFKDNLNKIINSGIGKDTTFESWVKPHHALSISERTQYFKKMLNKG
jgi:hypothetical protein